MNFLEDLFKKDNLLAKIISLVVACFLWAYVMMEQNPIVERYYEVPLQQRDVAETMAVFNAPEVVTVQVRASRLLLGDSAVQDIVAYIDLQDVAEGQQKLPVTAVFTKGEVVNVLPKEVNVLVDHITEKTVPVETSVVDNSDEDITVDSKSINPAKAVVRGAIFDFRGALMPVEFSAINPNAIKYFVGLGASNATPTFTCVWGRQVSETIVREIRTESAFGEDEVREVKNTRKDFVITGASKEPYAWDDESTLTAAEVAEAVANRETYLATIKQRQDEYKASKNAATAAPAPSKTGFNF